MTSKLARPWGRVGSLKSPARPWTAGLLATALTISLGGAAALAQPTGTRTSTTGEVERRLPEAPLPPRPALPAPALPELAAPAPAIQPFVLLGVSIIGSTVFDADKLLPEYEGLLARRVGAVELDRLATAIAARYRRDGYALVSVFVPPQSGESGIAIIRVIEARIERVVIADTGDAAAQARVERMTAALRSEHPLRQATLERALLLIGDLPGIELVGPRLRPLDLASGRLELVLPVRRRAFDGALAFDNRGSRGYGPWQLWSSGRVNWLDEDAAWSAQLALFTAPFSPREIRYGQAEATRSLGSDGMTLRALVSGSDNVAGGSLDAVDTRTGSRRFVLGLAYPVVRSRAASVWGSLTADALRATEDRSGRRFFVDELRVLRLGLTGLFAEDADRSTLLSVQASFGLDGLGATGAGALRSRPSADARFAALRADVTHVRPLFGPLALELRAGAQIADGGVFSAEEFDLGGARYGRAFEPGVLSGDRAFAGGIELRYADPITIPPIEKLELFAFADGGTTWLTTGDRRVRDHLSSVGVGIRGGLGAWRGSLELGQPIDSSIAALRRQGPRIFLSIATEF